MANWRYKVDVKEAFDEDNDMTFEQRRDHCVAALRNVTHKSHTLRDLVDELADTDTEDYFNKVWSEIYDWADRNLVWIGTF